MTYDIATMCCHLEKKKVTKLGGEKRYKCLHFVGYLQRSKANWCVCLTGYNLEKVCAQIALKLIVTKPTGANLYQGWLFFLLH